MTDRIILSLLMLVLCGVARADEGYEVHDKRRAQPPVVTPPSPSTQEQAGKAPSDAVALFDGTDLSNWKSEKGGDAPAPWKVVDGSIEIAAKTGAIVSKDQFADCQLHVEWMEPQGITGKSQGRGNSGIFLMGLYELQVLDNYQAETYADGMAGSIYGQYPPLANATRPPGQWQSYDVVFQVRGREGDQARARDRVSQRCARAGRRRVDRPHAAQGTDQVPDDAPGQGSDLVAGPRQPDPLPQHLGEADPRRKARAADQVGGGELLRQALAAGGLAFEALHVRRGFVGGDAVHVGGLGELADARRAADSSVGIG